MGLKVDTRDWTKYEGSVGYVCTTESMTDPYQYVPMAMELERMFVAGQQLEQNRRAIYNASLEDDDFIAPSIYGDAFDVIETEKFLERHSEEIHKQIEAEKAEAEKVEAEKAEV